MEQIDPNQAGPEEGDRRLGPARGPSGGSGNDEGPADPAGFVRMALIFYGVMGSGALLWRMSTPGQSILYPSPEAMEGAFSPLTAAGVGLLLGLGVVGISELMTRMTDLGDALAETLGEAVAGIRTPDAWLLALASGLGEELFFRGALQPAVGLVWASLVFGACHFLPRRELALWSLFAVVTGFALGGLYEWTGHLAAPVTAHVVVNGINLPRLARRAEEKTSSESDS